MEQKDFWVMRAAGYCLTIVSLWSVVGWQCSVAQDIGELFNFIINASNVLTN
jgi:hypothetical protein